jgi:adenylate cyclase
MKHETIRFEQQRAYPIAPAEAWRILADTDHLNRAIGLPKPDFTSVAGESLLREVRTRRLLIVPVRWQEFPFDWVRGRHYLVRREFDSGPIACVEGGIELTPAMDGGVVVKAFADFTPANLMGRVAWRVGRAPVSGVLEFCDRYLQRRDEGKPDPVPVPTRRTPVDAVRLERGIAKLRRGDMRPRLVEALRQRVLEGSDDQLVRVRPFALADAWGADRLEVLRLFLHAARAGLFGLRWELMCPNCRVPKAEAGHLSQLPKIFHCDTCGISYAVDFDERVELRFSVDPELRAAADELYCIGSPLRTPHIVAQQYLRSHEERSVDVELSEPLRLRTVGATAHLDLDPAPPNARVSEVKITYASGHWVGPHSLMHDECLAVPAGARLRLHNQTDGPVLAVLEEAAWTDQAATAAEVTALQDFRDLFDAEMLAPGEQFAVGSLAVLAGGGEMSGDGVKRLAAAHNGVVVKSDGRVLLCAFRRLDDAFAAALALQGEGRLGLGLHEGPVLAATVDNRLDYLGDTVDVAASLRSESRIGDIVLLPETLAQLTPAGVELETFAASARGLEPGRELVRVTPARSAQRTTGK